MRIEDGESKTANRRRRIEDGESKTANRRRRIEDGRVYTDKTRLRGLKKKIGRRMELCCFLQSASG
ncbi:MAG: hypothetical protein EAZ39_16495 [Oscillatoriales cyanobacterium]|nr:MAG: hypothetical protein EAZ39_16495 [Oscillatoriales cyanobacterium]